MFIGGEVSKEDKTKTKMKISPKFLLLSALILLSGILDAAAVNYKVETKKDTNGYEYKTVAGDPMGVRIYALKNGLLVYLSLNKDEPRIQTYIAVRTGSANDPAESTGLAHYLEHMMFKGASTIGAINWEAEKELLKQISDLYEKHRTSGEPEKKKEIYKVQLWRLWR